MISDEMRELLSTYVDGELRDSDAARVEDMVKHDPELRREVDAYRILRRQLKEWDAAEHGEPPSPALAEKALTRARAYASVTREIGRGRLVRLLGHPLLAAAGLLLATAVGLLLAAREEGRTESVAVLLPPSTVNAVVEPAPDLGHRGGAVVRPGEMPPVQPDRGPTLHETLKKHLRGYLVEGRVVSEAALRLVRVWEVERRRDERLLAKGPSARGTDARSPEILAMVGTYEALKVPAGGLVILTHPEPQHPPAAFAIPAQESVAFEPAKERELVYVDYESEEPVVVLAGEVLRGERDRSGRTRVVKASSWIAPREGGLVAITWADNIDLPTDAKDLTTQSYMLGPEARRRLVTADARDEDFLSWLRATYKARTVSEAFRDRGGKRDRAVRDLVGLLERERKATGFAVVANGKVLGVELFSSHKLMMAFAPRLLHGYMVEAGTESLTLETEKDETALVDLAQDLVDRVPNRVLRLDDVQEGSVEQWPSDLRRVNLRGPLGRIAGHGLTFEGRPLHVHLFGEE